MNKKDKILFIFQEWLAQAAISNSVYYFTYRISDVPKDIMDFYEAKDIIQSILIESRILDYGFITIGGNNEFNEIKILANKSLIESALNNYLNNSKTSNLIANDINKNLSFIADITEKFALYIEGNTNMWNMKQSTNNAFSVSGKHIFNLLIKLGEALIEREEKNNIVTSLSNKLEITPKQANLIFFNKDGKWGLRKDKILLK